MCPQFRRSLYSSAMVQAPPLGRVKRQVKAFWMERVPEGARKLLSGQELSTAGIFIPLAAWPSRPSGVEGGGFLQGLQSETRINDSPVAVGAFSGAGVDF